MYDFRDGILLEKAAYKDDSCDWKSKLLYIGFVLVAYCWAFAWFILFYYLYGNFEKTVFWVWIAIFLLHFAILISVGVSNIQRAKAEKAKRKKEEADKKLQEEKISNLRRQKVNNVKNKNENVINEVKNTDENLIESGEKMSSRRFNTETQALQ